MNEKPADFQVRLQWQRPDFALDVDLHLPATGVTALFGPSGAGKTTVLRCVAGLETAARGLVRLGDNCWQDSARGHFVPTWQRPIGYVFQEPSLLDHLDVLGNVSLGLPRQPTPAQKQALAQTMEWLGIAALAQRRPHQLSGGERQRVAMARALVLSPRLLLLDEPLAALDEERKQDILPWLERLRDELAVPMLYVSHAAHEVARLAHTVVRMAGGQVVAQGTVQHIMRGTPSDAGVWLVGQVCERDAAFHLARVAVQAVAPHRDEAFAQTQTAGQGALAVWLPDAGFRLGQTLRLRVAARDVSITTAPPRETSIQNHWQATVQALAVGAHPSQVLVTLDCGGVTLLSCVTARAAHALALQVGQPVWAQLKSVAVVS